MKRNEIKQGPYETYTLKNGKVVRSYWIRNEGYIKETAYHYLNDVQISLTEKDELIKDAIDFKIGS